MSHCPSCKRPRSGRADRICLEEGGVDCAREQAVDETIRLRAEVTSLREQLEKAREAAGLLAAYSTTAGAADHACKVHGAKIVELERIIEDERQWSSDLKAEVERLKAVERLAKSVAYDLGLALHETVEGYDTLGRLAGLAIAEVTSLRTRVEALTQERDAALKEATAPRSEQRLADERKRADALSAKCAEMEKALTPERYCGGWNNHAWLDGKCETCGVTSDAAIALASSPDSALARVEARGIREALALVEKLQFEWEHLDPARNALEDVGVKLRALATEREKRTTTEAK